MSIPMKIVPVNDKTWNRQIMPLKEVMTTYQWID